MKRNYFVILLLFGLLVIGCRQAGIRGLVPCSGVVLKSGQPVGGVDLTFVPVSTSPESRAASAKTEADGTFHVSTQAYKGILPGEYQVILSKKEPKVDNSDPSIPENYRTVSYIEQMGKYADANKSGLSAAIPKGGEKNLEIKID
ncbi:MAG: hypothetical protein LBQ54_07915 [Planctomycetaceae bacterium]|nr:hypothetical protein [Planctomycetaceae bacterium]